MKESQENLLLLAKELDNADIDVTKFEANVLETIFTQQYVSNKQARILYQMEEKYLKE